jgi:hypothetical protein
MCSRQDTAPPWPPFDVCWLTVHLLLPAATSTKPVFSSHGLLTTVAFQLGPQAPCVYALEVCAKDRTTRWGFVICE